MSKDSEQITPFQKKVYDAVCRIPPGRVTTYGLLARYISCQSCRAVGQALRRNPFAPQVPCHRVIASDMTIGGFGGERTGPGPRRKRALLEREGVQFDRGRLADPERLYGFPGSKRHR